MKYNTFMEMNMKNNPLQSIVSLLESISSLARLELLLLIGAGEACVCHLETQLGYRQAYISQHLMALRQAGLLDSRRAGKYIFYRLAKPEVLSLIQQVAQMIGVDLPHIATVTLEQQCGCPTCTPSSDLVSLNQI